MLALLAILLSAAAPGPAGEPRLACVELWNGTGVAQATGALLVVARAGTGKFDVITREEVPARQFPRVVRTRARSGSRDECFATVRLERVDGGWSFDEAGMRHLRSLPIAPEEAAVHKLLADGFAATHPGARVHAGKGWRSVRRTDFNCEEVLDAP